MSTDFDKRHPAYGASVYENGVGSDYVAAYEDICNYKLPTISNTLHVGVTFKPRYRMSKSIKEIIEFIRE